MKKLIILLLLFDINNHFKLDDDGNTIQEVRKKEIMVKVDLNKERNKAEYNKLVKLKLDNITVEDLKFVLEDPKDDYSDERIKRLRSLIW